MPTKPATYTPGPKAHTVRDAKGRVVPIPKGWVLLPPGDAAATRRVKAAGEHFLVQEAKGRRNFSRGVYAPAETIRAVQSALEAERQSPEYARKRAADARRRERVQQEYVGEFTAAVRDVLAFHPDHAALADRLARVVAEHATPVGSGTVARTSRIPLQRRAEAAVIAWLRHQTTGYDDMVIPRTRGKRREVRRMLAAQSRRLLENYRDGRPAPQDCPLRAALTAARG